MFIMCFFNIMYYVLVLLSSFQNKFYHELAMATLDEVPRAVAKCVLNKKS